MRLVFFLPLTLLVCVACQPDPPSKATPITDPEAMGSPSNKPIPERINTLYIRAFKSEKQLEVWYQPSKSEKYSLYHSYPVLRASGKLGPKRKEGDGQVPEGLYYVDRFNPESQFHLSLGLNYPNASDLVRSDQEKPGTDIFIHGSNVSIGCLAMGNDPIEEIYAIAEKAKASGNKIRVDIFPFRLSDENLDTQPEKYKDQVSFWRNELQPFYTYFENTRTPAFFNIDESGKYHLVKN